MNSFPSSFYVIIALSLFTGYLFGSSVLVQGQILDDVWDGVVETLDTVGDVAVGIGGAVVGGPYGIASAGSEVICFAAETCLDEEGGSGFFLRGAQGLRNCICLPKDLLAEAIDEGLGFAYTCEDSPAPACGGTCPPGQTCVVERGLLGDLTGNCDCVDPDGPVTTPGGGGTVESPSLACESAAIPTLGRMLEDLEATGQSYSNFFPIGASMEEGYENMADAWCSLHVCEDESNACGETVDSYCYHVNPTDKFCDCVAEDGGNCGPGTGSGGPITPGGSGPITPGGGGPTSPAWQSSACADAQWDNPYGIDDEVEDYLTGIGQDPSQWSTGPGTVNLIDLFNTLCSTKHCPAVSGVSCAEQPACKVKANLKGCYCTEGSDCTGPITPGGGPITPGGSSGPSTPPGGGPIAPGGGGGSPGPTTGYTYGGACAGSSTNSTNTIYELMQAAGVDMSSFASGGSFDQGAMKESYCNSKSCPSNDSSCAATCTNNATKEECECEEGDCSGDPIGGGCEFPDFEDGSGACVDVTPLPEPGCELPLPVNGGWYCADDEDDSSPPDDGGGCQYPHPSDPATCLDRYFEECEAEGGCEFPTGGEGGSTIVVSDSEASEGFIDNWFEKFKGLLGLE